MIDYQNHHNFIAWNTVDILCKLPKNEYRGQETMRRQIIKRIGDLLPTDFEGPKRDKGKSDFYWTNGRIYVVQYALYDMQFHVSIDLCAAQDPDIAEYDQVMKVVFNGLHSEFEMTMKRDGRILPFEPLP